MNVQLLAEKITHFCHGRDIHETWKRLSTESCTKVNGIWTELAATSVKNKTVLKKYTIQYYWTFKRNVNDIKKLVLGEELTIREDSQDTKKTRRRDDSTKNTFHISPVSLGSAVQNDNRLQKNKISSQTIEPSHSFDFHPNEFTAIDPEEAVTSSVTNLGEFLQPDEDIISTNHESSTQMHDVHKISIPSKKRKFKKLLEKKEDDKYTTTTIIIPKEFWAKYLINNLKLDNDPDKGNWHDDLFKLFSSVHPLCTIAFEYYHYNPSPTRINSPYFLAKAHCQFSACCKYEFHVHAQIKKSDSYEDTPCIITKRGEMNHHTKEKHRRPVRQWRRKELQKELKGSTPYKVETHMVNCAPKEILKSGNLNQVVDKSLLQKISSEANIEKKIDPDLMTGLQKLKSFYEKTKPGNHVSGFIQELGSDPFSITLFSEKQLMYLKSLNLNERLLYLDATGSLVAQPPWIKKQIYNYRLVLPGSKDLCALVIAEWISSDHFAFSIAKFIGKFIYDFRKICNSWYVIPKIETDYSFALLHSVCKEVNEISLWQYLCDRFNEETGKIAYKIFTILHICSSHTVKTVARKTPDFFLTNTEPDNSSDTSCESNVNLSKKEKKMRFSSFKKLILSAINLLIHSETLDNAAAICENILIIFGLPYETEDFYKILELITKTDNIPRASEDVVAKLESNDKLIVQNHDDFINTDIDDCRLLKDSPFYYFFNEIREKVQNKILKTKNIINELYSPKFIEYLFEFLLPMYPCWSSIIIMRINIRRDSDAVIENNWRLLKGNICKNHAKQSAQIYVQAIEPYINADIDRRSISIKGVNRRHENTTNIDSTAFAKETWVHGNHHFKGTKYLRVSIGCQTHSDSSISLNEVEYSTQFSNLDDDDFDKINLIKVQEECDTIETDCNNTNIENMGINENLKDNFNIIPRKKMHQMQCVDICDIYRVNIFKDFIDYPKEFPGQCKASIYGIIIDIDSWVRLKENACLNDNIINGFLMVMSDVAKISLGLKVVPIESFFTESLLSKSGLSVGYRSKLASLAVWENDVCLLPVNAKNFHWSLVVVIPKLKLILYLDSLHLDPHDKLLERLCAALETVSLKLPQSQKPKWAEWVFCQPSDIPSQQSVESRNNCGVHVCSWMNVICTGSSYKFEETHMNTARKAITHILNGRKIEKTSSRMSCDAPKLRKTSRTFERMPHKPEPPLDNDSTLDFLSSLASVLVDNTTSDIDSYDYDSNEEQKTLLYVNREEHEQTIDSDGSICNWSMETDEKIEEDFGQNAVSFINIFDPTNEFPADFPHRELILFDTEVITMRLETLYNWTYISDVIIDIFLLLVADHAEKTRNLKVLPFPAYMVTSIMDPNARMNYVSWAKTAEIWQQQIWLLPVNLGNSHWTLFIIIPSLKEMIYLNSIKNPIPNNLLMGIFAFMSLFPDETERKCKKKDPKNWKIYNPRDIPQQDPLHGHCGGHLMAWAYILCTSMVVNFREEDMEAVRKGVAMILYQSKTTSAENLKVTRLAEILLSEPRVALIHKNEKFHIRNKKNNGCDMQTSIALLAFELYEN